MKNIRSNLLNGEKFDFPGFIYNDGLNIDINFAAGFIQWKDLYDIYDKEKGWSANLNKASKLSYQVLHKQITSKMYHQHWQSYTKLPLLLPEAIFLLDQIYPDF